MTELQDRLNTIDRSLVIDDAVKLIDSEVASKRGFSGAALKGGYKVVKKLKSGRMIEVAVDHLLDDFTGALSELYEDFLESDESKFEVFLAGREDAAANALLTITDDKVEGAENRIIIKTYKKLRGSAKPHVEDAIPGVGRLIDTHAPRG